MQRVRLVAHVPDQRDAAARPEDALQLGQGAIGIEPVERLRRRDGVGGPVVERDRLRRPLDDLGVDDALEDLPHLGDRLDARHAQTARDELPRELARAGSDVDDVRARLELEHLDDVVERGRRVVGARLLVHLGRRLEAARGRVDAQYAPLRPKTAGIVFSRIVTSSQIDQFSR